jgi:hypothetical protein
MTTATKPQRPEPLSAPERAAMMARYELKGVKGFLASDGYAFKGTLYRDGKKFLIVEQNGNGGPNYYYSTSKKAGTQRERVSQLEADAIAWWVGSNDEAEMATAVGKPVEEMGFCEVEDIFVGELRVAAQDRQFLMKNTAGGKGIAFQVGDDIGTDQWQIYSGYLSSRHHPTVAAKAARVQEMVAKIRKDEAGKRLRVVYRGADLKVLKDEVIEA